ncbi:MAG: patatin family protein [Proteobacteria bacterium]|nr:patatin family protein [Pseudomonadota bacterium]
MKKEDEPFKIPLKTSLILEGGGLRGIYSSGILKFLMEKEIWFPYVIGVSSGACNGSNYVSRQIERNRIVNIDFVKDPRYLSVWRWLLGGELFGMDFLFDALPNDLAPFDFKTFENSKQVMVTGVSDCITGKPVYFNQHETSENFLTVLRASCSLPLFAPPVKLNGRHFMDGGITEAIPIRKSIKDGNQKHVIILTRPKGYEKKPSKLNLFLRLKYPQFKGLINVFSTRHQTYNETLEHIENLENEGKAFVFRPPSGLSLGRTEKDTQKLTVAYERGYEDIKQRFQEFINFLSSSG